MLPGGTHSHRLTQLRIRPPLSVSCRSQPGPEAHALGGTHSHTHSCTHPATSVARHSQPGPEAHALRFLPPHELELVDLELRRRGFHCRLSLSLYTVLDAVRPTTKTCSSYTVLDAVRPTTKTLSSYTVLARTHTRCGPRQKPALATLF